MALCTTRNKPWDTLCVLGLLVPLGFTTCRFSNPGDFFRVSVVQSVTRPEILDESESGNLELVVSMTSPSPGILTLWSRKRVRVREFGIDGLVTESGRLVPKTNENGTGFAIYRMPKIHSLQLIISLFPLSLLSSVFQMSCRSPVMYCCRYEIGEEGSKSKVKFSLFTFSKFSKNSKFSKFSEKAASAPKTSQN